MSNRLFPDDTLCDCFLISCLSFSVLRYSHPKISDISNEVGFICWMIKKMMSLSQVGINHFV